MKFYCHGSNGVVPKSPVFGVLIIKTDCPGFFSDEGTDKETTTTMLGRQCLVPFLSPFKNKKKRRKKNISAQGSHEPLGHYFNTSKQSNYQCYYLHSIVMELMLWQIVVSASFQIHSYSKSCVSSDCLESSSTHRPPSVFLRYVSIVTPLFLFQSISRSNSHTLASYWNS